MRHVISILIENEAGALSRVVGLFSQRGYNIESLTVAPTDDKTLSRCTISTEGSSDEAEQITKQLHKLVCVLRVSALHEEAEGGLEREMVLVKISTPNRNIREEVKTLAEIFNAKIIDVNADIFTIEYVGSSSETDNMLQTLKKLTEIIEVVRSGVLGIAKGSHCMRG
ncbi:MAG: acetolactate synthase small subunit [Succinatimonas sp.]|nr:acetolactate synthase small subunit [Succinatimonas sp.]